MSDTRTPDEIERELEQNREGLRDTLGALQNSFSAESVFRSITTDLGRHGDAWGRSAMDAARGNPLALALTGIGLGWLMFGSGPSADRIDRAAREAGDFGHRRWSRHEGRDDETRIDPREPVHGASEPAWMHDPDPMPAGDPEVGGVGAATTGTGSEHRRHRVEAMRARLSHGTERMNASARERVIAARERAMRARDQTRRQAGRGAQHGMDFFEDHPLAAGAMAIAAGALIAGTLRHTETEDRYLGGESDKLIADAERIFREESDKAMNVAGAALDEASAATREAREESGATVRHLKDEADRRTSGEGSAADAAVERTEDAVRRVADAAGRKAEEENLGRRDRDR